MLRRNLLYTAITRSKQYLILCGEEEAFQLGVMRTDDGTRQTTLYEKLTAIISPEQQLLPMEDANIGMEGVTPYDFMENDAT